LEKLALVKETKTPASIELDNGARYSITMVRQLLVSSTQCPSYTLQEYRATSVPLSKGEENAGVVWLLTRIMPFFVGLFKWCL